MKGILRDVLVALGMLLSGNVVNAQSSLVLSSGCAATGSPVSLDLTLTSSPGTQPVGFQWTFNYPASSVASFAVTATPALTAAGKTLSCGATSARFTCIAIGIDTNQISNGIVANVSVTLAAAATSVAVGVSGLGVAWDGSSISTVTAGGTASHSAASQPAILTNEFGKISIGSGATTTLTFTLSNPNTNMPLTGLAFVDPLPAGLIVANPNALTGSCGQGTIAAPAGGGSIGLASATIAAANSCTFSVNVTATGSVLNLLTNPSIPVTSEQAPAGASDAISIFIGDPFQVNYFPNLDLGDSIIHIMNTGASWVAGAFDTLANVNGAICVNAYAFSPDEQMVSCCSCLVTPNGLVSLSVRDDLIGNTLTPTAPASVVVKLVVTAPIAGTCSTSASTISLAGLSAGMAAWGTKIHTFAKAPWGTETAFTGSILSIGELARLSNLCTSIHAIGSGYGICQSCRFSGRGPAGR